MKHISEEAFINHILDDQSVTELTHLAICDECREIAQSITTLANELTLLRLSEPTPTQRKLYQTLFKANSV